MGLFKKWKNEEELLDGIFLVEMKDKSGFALYNKEEKFLTPERFDRVDMFANQKFMLGKRNGKIAIMLKDINARSPYMMTGFDFDGVERVFGENEKGEAYSIEKYLLVMDEDNRWSFLDTSTFEVVPGKFLEKPKKFLEGLCVVKIVDKYTYFREEDGKLMEVFAKKAYPFSSGLGRVETKNGIGYVDKNGKIFLVKSAEEAEDFLADGFANVKDAKGWTLINKDGKFMPYRFEDIRISLKHGTDVEREGIIFYENQKYSVTILNGEIANEEWKNLVKTNAELFQFIPDYKFRDKKFVKQCKDIANELASRLIERKRIKPEEVERADKIQKIVYEKCATAEANNKHADEIIARREERKLVRQEEKARKIEEERLRVLAEKAAEEKKMEEARRSKWEKERLALEEKMKKQNELRSKLTGIVSKDKNEGEGK